MPNKEKFCWKIGLSRVAYIMYFLMFSRSLDFPGLWLCIKIMHDQQFVKETAFYREQLLFQIFTILPFLASKPPNFNWKLLTVIQLQTKNCLFISDLYTQSQTWRVQTFLFCNISHPTEYFVRLNFLSKKPIHRGGFQIISWNHMEVDISINLRFDKLI